MRPWNDCVEQISTQNVMVPVEVKKQTSKGTHNKYTKTNVGTV